MDLAIENPNLRTIYLHGALGRKFGWKHRLAVTTPREAVSALGVLRKGFTQFFWRESAHYTFLRGKTRRNGVELNEIELGMLLGKEDFHIVPVTAGGKGGAGKGIGKVVLGVAMVAGAFFTAGASLSAAPAIGIGAGEAVATTVAVGATAGWGASVGGLGLITAGQLGVMGAMMALGGISQLITPTPKIQNPAQAYGQMEAPAARPSFIYGGPANTMEQGGPVPIIYGRMRVGSTLMSASITSDDT